MLKFKILKIIWVDNIAGYEQRNDNAVERLLSKAKPALITGHYEYERSCDWFKYLSDFWFDEFDACV